MRHSRLLILICACFAGCSPLGPSRTCEEIAARELRALLQSSSTPEQLRAQVAKIYALPLGQVALDANGLGWTKDGVYGEMAIKNSTPISASLNYRVRPPSADAVTNCLGAPDSYWAWYHYYPGATEHTLEFEMFFPQQGMLSMVQERSAGREPPKLTGSIQMVYFLFIRPDPIEDVMDRLTSGLATDLRQQVQPWPGKWEDVVVEIDPSLRQ